MTGISFVITVYNKAEFLPHVVNALNNQDGNFKKQFIFVDDGSTDNSLDLLYHLTHDLNDCEIIHQNNYGPSNATNKGIGVAKYPYLKLVDGDDVLDKSGTARLLKALNQTDCVLAYGECGTYEEVSGNIKLTEPCVGNTDKKIINKPLPLILKHAIFTPTHTLVRTNLLKNTNACDNRAFIQDYSFVLRAAVKTPFVKIASPVFYAPKQLGNRMSGNVAQTLHDLNAALFYFLKENKELSQEYRRYAAIRATGRALHWARRNNKEFAPLKEWLQYLFVKLYLSTGYEQIIGESCKVFQENFVIRMPLNIKHQ